MGTKDKDVIACLEELEWQASDWFKRRNRGKIILPVYADAHLLGIPTADGERQSGFLFAKGTCPWLSGCG